MKCAQPANRCVALTARCAWQASAEGGPRRRRLKYNRRFGPWRSLASALAWGARGPEFKSRRPDQIPQRLTDTNPYQTCGLESNRSPNADTGASLPTRTKNTAAIRGTALILEKPAIPDIFGLSD